MKRHIHILVITVSSTLLLLLALRAGTPEKAIVSTSQTGVSTTKKKGPPFFRSGTGEAEQLAAKLREMMLKYDAAVESKASAEEQFYLDQQETLRNLWLPGQIPTESKGTTEEDLKVRIIKSIPYLTISISARRAARAMAEGLAVDPTNATPVQNLLSYLDTGVQEDQALFAKAQGEQQRLRLELGESLAKIDLQDGLR